MRAPDFIRDRAKQLRHGMTLAERLLWIMLRRNVRGVHFRRQHPIGPFILDFYCAEAKLCIEIDGPVHDEADRIGRDLRRSAWLEQEGIRILRFTPAEVEFRPAYVLASITQATTGRD